MRCRTVDGMVPSVDAAPITTRLGIENKCATETIRIIIEFYEMIY